MFEALSEDGKERKKKILVLAITVGLALAVIGLVVALLLGTYGYHVRRTTLHEGRLLGMLEQEPKLHQVVEGLREKGPLIASPETKQELERWLGKWGDQKKDEILDKGQIWPTTRIFDAGDMIYFIYFDEEQIMRDFTYISTPDYKVR